MLDDIFFVNWHAVVVAIEGHTRQGVDGGWATAVAERMVEEEVMQFVGAHQVFGLLRDIAVFIGRDKFGADGGGDNVEQGLGAIVIGNGAGHPADEVAHQRLGDGSIEAIHTDMVACIGGPAQGQFAEVARADHEAAHLVGCIHQNLSALAGLYVLVGHVVRLAIVA